MNENLRHWDELGRTDPAHTKPFQRAGGFRGTATRPIWTEMRLTEHFGPCGIGWGCDRPEFTLVPAGEEMLVYCTLMCWYSDQGKTAELYGVGGDKVVTKRKDGSLAVDDEAYKKAFTDALGNAFKHLGAGADVHMGMFEDSKYVASMKREFSDGDGNAAERPVERAKPNGRPPLPPSLPPPPAPPAPPHDPSTGEVRPPHRITLPFLGGQPNYVAWGGQFIAALKSAGNYAEWLAWQTENSGFIAECAERAPKALASIKAAIKKTGEQYEDVDETLTEADVEQVLNA